MWIIDRYLLRQFLKTFLICFISLTGLCIVIDAFTHLEDFLRAGEKQRGLAAVMGWYYAYRVLWFFDLMAGLLTLIAAMFTATWIQRHNELTALMAAGISRVRVAAPIIAASVVILVVAAVTRETLIPRYRSELVKWPRDLADTMVREVQLQNDQNDVIFRGGKTYANRQRIERPDFLLPPSLSAYGMQLRAAEAFYKPPQSDRPAGYLLCGVEQPKELDKKHSLTIRDQPVIITPLDAPEWLKPGECFVVSDVTFEQLSESDGLRDYSSIGQLIRALRNPNQGFRLDMRVAIHARVVQPLLDFTLLFLGLPLVLARESRNVFVAIGLCSLVTAVFTLIVIGSHYLGTAGLLRSDFAAWAPLFLFVPLAVWLAESMWE